MVHKRILFATAETMEELKNLNTTKAVYGRFGNVYWKSGGGLPIILHERNNDAANLFASGSPFFSGLVFILAAGILLSPTFHRVPTIFTLRIGIRDEGSNLLPHRNVGLPLAHDAGSELPFSRNHSSVKFRSKLNIPIFLIL